MIEYQGWITIREAYDEANESQSKLEKIYMQLSFEIDKMQQNVFNRTIDISYFNGSCRLFVIGAGNHADERWNETFKLFELVSKIAEGSYGILSCWDNENKEGYENELQVFVMKKGTFMRYKDGFLSPMIPTVENPLVC